MGIGDVHMHISALYSQCAIFFFLLQEEKMTNVRVEKKTIRKKTTDKIEFQTKQTIDDSCGFID
jgi:hypothetical protein